MPRRLPSPAVAVAIAVALGAGAVACGGGEGPGACGPVRREPLDRRYLQHVLPNAPDIEYQTDPPTSGPHQPSPPVSGALDRPLTRPVQVGVLEAGSVLLQHDGLSASDRAALEDLAGGAVVVAPNPDLPDGTAVVATAWLTKQTCTALDLATLRAFTAERTGRGPDQ